MVLASQQNIIQRFATTSSHSSLSQVSEEKKNNEVKHNFSNCINFDSTFFFSQPSYYFRLKLAALTIDFHHDEYLEFRFNKKHFHCGTFRILHFFFRKRKLQCELITCKWVVNCRLFPSGLWNHRQPLQFYAAVFPQLLDRSDCILPLMNSVDWIFNIAKFH